MIKKPRLQTIADLAWQNKKHFSQNFQIAKRKKGWGVQIEDPHVNVFTIQKNTLFLFYRQILTFYLKKNFSFTQEGCHFLQGNGGRPFKG